MDASRIYSVIGASLSEMEAAAVAGILSVDHWNGLRLYASRATDAALPGHRRAIEAARGLVVDPCALERADWPITALPLMFFRDSEYLTQTSAEVEDITEKLDGALALSFIWQGRVQWTGRSSFSSPVAARANELWQERHADTDVPAELTLSCEVIHPETRVLIDYDFSDLVLIGARNRFNGEDLSYDALQTLGRDLGLTVVRRETLVLTDAIQTVREFTTQREGYVVRLRNGRRVKLSSPLYNAIYDLRKECSPWMISEIWGDGWDHGALTQLLPSGPAGHVERLMRFLDRQLASGQAEAMHPDRQQVVEMFRSAAKESLRAPLVEGLPDDV